MRGEHPSPCHLLSLIAGSSPHARGAHEREGILSLFRGIIPACAGSTVSPRAVEARGRDHPRMRGEHCAPPPRWSQNPGSSPHARGALYEGWGAWVGFGIIPACAGSTPTRRARRGRGKDHPRMRGEHFEPSAFFRASPGSSPHARGAPSTRTKPERTHGIIPACAGSTWDGSRPSRTTRDHPRMRGEHSNLPASLSDVLKQLVHFPQPTRDHHARRYRERNLCALRCLDALLHPVGSEPMSVASSVPTGRLMSFSPSQSTGTQSG